MQNKFFAIDLDRTLLNTNFVMSIVEKSCDQVGIKYDHAKIKKLALEQNGLSFEPLSYIKSCGDDKYENFERAFIENSDKEDLLYPDAHRLLKRLNDNSIDFLILTFGPIKWQTLKLSVSKLIDNPYVITDTQDKAAVISEWYFSNSFNSPFDHIAPKKNIVLIDDKPKAFLSHHPNCIGFLLDREEAFEDIELPSGVTRIKSLDEVSV